jgi:hypothetical protein
MTSDPTVPIGLTGQKGRQVLVPVRSSQGRSPEGCGFWSHDDDTLTTEEKNEASRGIAQEMHRRIVEATYESAERPHPTGVTPEGKLFFRRREGESGEEWIARIREGLREAAEEYRREHPEDSTDRSQIPALPSNGWRH